MISKADIEYKLNVSAKKYNILFYDSVSSTNTLLREMADKGAKDNRVLIAERQTAGKGRMGRSFFSPSDTGIYISILIHPDKEIKNPVFITTYAAVAACRAIEKTTDKKPLIKWVNDIIINGKKVCGILTESVFENGKMKYAVMGIGFNVFYPDSGFPNEIAEIAGAICKNKKDLLREEIAAEFLNQFSLTMDYDSFFDDYKKRNLTIGKKVEVINTANGDAYFATVKDIDENCCLVIKDEEGNTKTLSSGEIKIRLQQ